ncbi:uncharacterized protein MONOS_3738 [Monocercomonoides exilis]|uniref:uncharacterized protein n=1 Tax=Monocercomonoides exilis TaxID=2049356 RepID=UPI003559C785|nr:hypothetical protein MONOS_3738 [Monocercomonoides exilis]|eukprot:MONOS_3738.1-p1 / transcript=MONOS_3738.1 / gene=MONOS_3738 / organism=Monocercomonoides_exilis_PA203 / gene_product=unspecified product / transcript_product=unspecified product / location=Mono_scaffold00091:30420-30737(-) / protein_length=106 / sequence_SO=supercontig / SO=protein_coding / is_pseudo=false
MIEKKGELEEFDEECDTPPFRRAKPRDTNKKMKEEERKVKEIEAPFGIIEKDGWIIDEDDGHEKGRAKEIDAFNKQLDGEYRKKKRRRENSATNSKEENSRKIKQ